MREKTYHVCKGSHPKMKSTKISLGNFPLQGPKLRLPGRQCD